MDVNRCREDLANTALSNIVSLEAIFERRGEGDTGIYLPDTAEQSMPEEQLEQREIRFRSVAEDFDTGTDQGRFACDILKKVSQLDRKEKPEPRVMWMIPSYSPAYFENSS